jgi:hypothetical protein
MSLRRIRAVLSAILLCSSVALAQQTPAVHPAQDAPELYLSFFFFHEDFAKWTEARIAANPGKRGQFLNSSAKQIGISPDEFSALETISSDITASLRVIGDEAHQYVQSTVKAKGDIDHKVLVQFDSRRQAVIQDGINRMKNTLSTQGWQGLYSYINNQHRQHVNVVSPGANVTPPK